MSAFAEILLNNFTALCLAIGLAVTTIVGKSFDKKTNRSFLFFSLLIIVLIFTGGIGRYLSTLPTPTPLRYITLATIYTLRPISVVLIIDILLRRKGISNFLWIPVAVVGAIAYTSCFTHLMFWFSDTNRLMHGPVFYLSHVLGIIGLFVLVVLTLAMHRGISYEEIIVILYIVMSCVTAIILESILSDHYNLLTGTMITSCALYYLVLFLETYKRDSLTGLMNRRTFYMDAKTLSGKSLAVISVDLNHLKQINDLQGHTAGDKALQSIANALLLNIPKNFYPYRIGGDEFMVLGKEQTMKAAEEYMQSVCATIGKDSLTASFGCAMYKPGDSFDEVCNHADSLMYREKRRHHKRMVKRV